jgi:hypothetical protein
MSILDEDSRMWQGGLRLSDQRFADSYIIHSSLFYLPLEPNPTHNVVLF